MKSLIVNIAVLILTSVICFSQNANVRFNTELDCATEEYCVTLQVNSEDGFPFEIGTSSIFFTYNAEALEFKSYTSENFDENNKCIADRFSPYSAHQYDAKSIGKFNTTITLDIVDAACTSIEEEYVDIATICFTVTDATKKAELNFSEKHTNFNLATEEVELVSNLTFTDNNESLNCNVDYEVEGSFIVTNNPVRETANVQFDLTEETTVVLGMYDLSGRLLETKTETLNAGISQVQFDTSNSTPGMYIIKDHNNPAESGAKVVKQ